MERYNDYQTPRAPVQIAHSPDAFDADLWHCGGYLFFYRAALIAVPAVAFEQQLFNPQTPLKVCGSDEDHLRDPIPILSAAYQARIASQKPSPNLVNNAAMTQTNPTTNEPAGYSRNIDTSTATFEYLKDSNDQSLFLRVTNNQAGASPAPSWQMDPIAISPDKTYAYGFTYRSASEVQVSIETQKNGASRYKSITTLPASNEWKELAVHFDNVDDVNSLRVFVSSSAAGYVDTRNFTIREIPSAKLKQGVVSMSFDDGWASIDHEALVLLNQYSIRTTQYIISDISSHQVPGYMSLDTIFKLKQSGHEIGSHSLQHCNQTELSQSQIEDNARRSKEILEQHHLGPIKSFAYPSGQYNQTTQKVYEKYYPLIRSSDFGYNDAYFDETNIHSMGVTEDTTLSDIQSWMQYAKEHHMWLVLVYHRVNESGHYNISKEQLEKQLKAIKDSQVLILPISEAAHFARQ